jgi:hypothetical protein
MISVKRCRTRVESTSQVARAMRRRIDVRIADDGCIASGARRR